MRLKAEENPWATKKGSNQMKARSLLTSHPVAICIATGCDSTNPPKVVSPFSSFEGRMIADWADDNRNMMLVQDFA